MDRLVIRVLGGLDVQLAGADQPLELPTRKCRALVAYLALSPAMSRSREHLANVFWCRSAEEQARASLRQTLSSTRRACSAGPLVHADAESVRLDPGTVDVDALRFEHLASQDSTASLPVGTPRPTRRSVRHSSRKAFRSLQARPDGRRRLRHRPSESR